MSQKANCHQHLCENIKSRKYLVRVITLFSLTWIRDEPPENRGSIPVEGKHSPILCHVQARGVTKLLPNVCSGFSVRGKTRGREVDRFHSVLRL